MGCRSVTLFALVTGLAASVARGQTCPGTNPVVGPPAPCVAVPFWSKCGATGLVCTPPASGTGACLCRQPPKCGDMVDGTCASAAACSGTNTGYLAPCGFGEQCNPFGPAAAAPCCLCVKPACQPSTQHSKLVQQSSCVGGANDGQLCEPWRACADCPNGTCSRDVIPDYEFSDIMRAKLVQNGMSNVLHAKFFFEECFSGGMLDDLASGRCSITDTQCCYQASDCPNGETCVADPNKGLGTTVPWVGGSAAAWDESSIGFERRCADSDYRKCYTDADCPPAGRCSVTAARCCFLNADCPPAETCNPDVTCLPAVPPPPPLCRIPLNVPLGDAANSWTVPLNAQFQVNPNQPLTTSIDRATSADIVGPNAVGTCSGGTNPGTPCQTNAQCTGGGACIGFTALEHGQTIVQNGGETITLADPGAASHHAILWAGNTDGLRHYNDIAKVRDSLYGAWNPKCVGGGNANQPCKTDADCPGGNCPASVTVLYGDGMHQLENHCVGGTRAATKCDCPGGTCPGSPSVCSCGARAGQPCGSCPGGACVAGTCNAGANAGQPCGTCPGGSCQGQCAGGVNAGRACRVGCPGGGMCVAGDPLPADWNAQAATKKNLENAVNGLPLDPNEQFFFYASDHGDLDMDVKPPAAPPKVVPPGGTDREPFDIPRTVLVAMLRAPDNEPTLTITYSGVQTADTDCVTMPDPVTGSPVTLGCLDPALTTMEFPVPESVLWLTTEIDITNLDPVSIQILGKDLFTGEIPTLPAPNECHQGDFPGFAFLVRTFGKIGNDAQIAGNIGANDPGGLFRLGKGVFGADGDFVAGDTVQLGIGTSVFDVLTNRLLTSSATIRGVQGLPLLPLDTDFCPLRDFTCGGPDVTVQPGTTVTLVPGSYGKIAVLGGGTLVLGPGAFELCSFRTGKNAVIRVTGSTQTAIDVTGTFRLADGSTLTRDFATPIPLINVVGRLVRVSASSTLEGFIHAPNAEITFGRSAVLTGSFCANTSRSDKHVTLRCPLVP